MTRTGSYDEIPEGMKRYINNYGPHFNKKLCKEACSRMYKESNGKKEYIRPYTKEEVDAMLEGYNVKLKRSKLYDAVYVANMCQADFLGSSIMTEEHLAKYVKDVIDAIHTAGGIAILAHPVKSGCTEILDDYIEYGIDGIEVFHPSANEDEQAELKKFATKNKLLMTGGSDFHGLYNEYKVSLGDYSTPDDCLHALLTYKSKQKRLQKKLAQQSAE